MPAVLNEKWFKDVADEALAWESVGVGIGAGVGVGVGVGAIEPLRRGCGLAKQQRLLAPFGSIERRKSYLWI